MIDEIFGADATISSKVRFINAIKTNIPNVERMYIADGFCNVFARVKQSEGHEDKIVWHRFDASESHLKSLLVKKQSSPDMSYQFDCPTKELNSRICVPSSDGDWLLKFGNRDLDGSGWESSSSTAESPIESISDALLVKCTDTTTRRGEPCQVTLWYLSEIDGYLYSIMDSDEGVEDQLVDVAYEQYGNRLYVIFKGDTHVYRYDNVDRMKDFRGWIQLNKGSETMKIDTFHSRNIQESQDDCLKWIYIDYSNGEWTIKVYGQTNGQLDVETWVDSPGKEHGFNPNVPVFFGDTLFNGSQIKFQNISKNKEMFDILDIQDVDGCFYGLFKNENRPLGQVTYTAFKCPPTDDGVVERLPYDIVLPQMYVTSDDLYSLYVVSMEDGSLKLREISVPHSDLYVNRVFDIPTMLSKVLPDDELEELDITQVMMQGFVTDTTNSSSHIDLISNKGFHRVGYEKVTYDTYIQDKED